MCVFMCVPCFGCVTGVVIVLQVEAVHQSQLIGDLKSQHRHEDADEG